IMDDVLANPRYRPVLDAIWNHARPQDVPETEAGRIKAAEDVAMSASRQKDAIVKSDIYKRLNFEELGRMWRESAIFRGGAVATGALAVVGTVGAWRQRRKDRSADEISQPLPGG